MSSAASVTAALASCRQAMRQLTNEKIALVGAVLALKEQERVYWQSCVAQDQAVLFFAQQALKETSLRTSKSEVAELQHTIKTRTLSLETYEKHVELATASEVDMRALLGRFQDELTRLSRDLDIPAPLQCGDTINDPFDGVVHGMHLLEIEESSRGIVAGSSQ